MTFDEWVKRNYVGQPVPEPPADWDPKTEFFYQLSDAAGAPKYRIRYDVPVEFRRGNR